MKITKKDITGNFGKYNLEEVKEEELEIILSALEQLKELDERDQNLLEGEELEHSELKMRESKSDTLNYLVNEIGAVIYEN